ncbi:MAG: DUF4430 domain-containing protein [Candidatus Diapherotrites archaeon]
MVTLTTGCTEESPSGEMTTVSISVDYLGTDLVNASVEVAQGSNGLDAMKKVTEVQYQDSAYGAFVQGIGGVESDDFYYWALYVNGSYADRAIDQYEMEEGMEILWKFEEIQAFPVG